MSSALIFKSGTGDLLGAAGVKAAKLYVEQDQIGKRLVEPGRAFGLIAKDSGQSLS